MERPSRTALGLFLIGTLGIGLQPVYGQGGFPGASDDEQAVNVRVYPEDFWGPRVGVGAGVGVVGHNLARPYDQWLVTVAPARHEQAGTISFASADPHRARRSLLVDARVLHSDRDWTGPWTLTRSAVRTRVRGGQTFFNRRLLVQPHATAMFTEVSGIDDRDGFSAAQRTATQSPAEDAYTGLRTGLSLRYDSRGGVSRRARGVRLQGTWDHYLPLDGPALQFDQFDLDAYGTLLLYERHRLALRLHATLTTGDRPPLHMQPTLSGTVVPGWKRAQFVGPDRLLGSLLYRFPLWSPARLPVIEGHLGGHLANVYRDLPTEFSPTVSSAETVSAVDPPLRPSASAGLRIAVPFRPRLTLDLAIGGSPDGVTATTVSFSRRLQSVRRPHHSADPVR
ncbi:MAG: hypothetical protein BRD55_02975 [Bacteroidetes bacterium SW_9_63_38]|nr:MAG: hypothetical protein BRD55_02975 [Bacteroidetes bacterium SW_9_63_38]